MASKRNDQPDKPGKVVKQRTTSGEEIPSNPELRRQGDQPGAGANTPAGPFPRRGTEEAKRAREKQGQISARDRAKQD